MTNVLDLAAQETHYSDAQREIRAKVRQHYLSGQAAIAGFADVADRVTKGDLTLMADRHQQMTQLLGGAEAALIQSMQNTMAIVEQMEAAILAQGHVLFGIPYTPEPPSVPGVPLPEPELPEE